MRDKFWELVIFIEKYPKGLNILIFGICIIAIYYSYGVYSVSKIQLTNPSLAIQGALRDLVMGMYEEKSLAFLIFVIAVSCKQLAKDKKKFDRFG